MFVTVNACSGFRHRDNQNEAGEFVSSAVSFGDSCECSDVTTLRYANVTTASSKQCDPIVLCKLSGGSDVCVRQELLYAVPADIREIRVVSKEDTCIRGDGSNGLEFRFSNIGPT